MRYVSPNATNSLLSSRVIDARATIRKTHVSFIWETQSDEILDDIMYYDSSTYEGKIIRIATVYDSNNHHHLWYQIISYPDRTWPKWKDSGFRVKPFCKPGVFEDRVFFHSYDMDKVVYSDVTTNTEGNDYVLGYPNAIWDDTSITPYGFAPVSKTEFYVQWQFRSPPLTGLNYSFIEMVDIYGNTLSQWWGRIFGEDSFLTGFDAVRLSGDTVDDNAVDMIVLSDNNSNRGMYLTHSNLSWSQVSMIFPLDVVSDYSRFEVGGISMVDGKPWISGILDREDSPPMHIYLIGPEHWSLGREMFIGSSQQIKKPITIYNTSDTILYSVPVGKIFDLENRLWYIGPGLKAYAEPTQFIGKDLEGLKSEVTFSKCDLSNRTGEPSRLQMYLKYDDELIIDPGFEITLEAAYSDNWFQMGVYDIDGYNKQFTQNGKDAVLVATGRAMKRLSRWKSDSSYDYWSQNKLASNPTNTGEIVRVSGTWSGDPLQLDNLNMDGYAYSIMNASRGCVASGRFMYSADTYFVPTFGVIANYYRDTKNKYNNGIIAAWSTKAHNNTPGIAIWIVRNDIWTLLTSTGYPIDEGVFYWLQIQFQEGRIIVLAREDSEPVWTEKINTIFNHASYSPWARDDMLGRGGLYVRNQTLSATCYPFASDDVIIPISNATEFNAFPTSDIVIVDEEIIEYSSKSYSAVYSDLVRGGSGLIFSRVTSGTSKVFSNTRSDVAIKQILERPEDNTVIDYLQISIKKYGAITDNLTVRVCIDNGSTTGSEIASVSIPNSQITDTFSPISINLSSSIAMDPNSTYFLLMHRSNNPTNPDGTGFEIRTGPTIGLYSLNESTDVWASQSVGISYVIHYHTASINSNTIFLDGLPEPLDPVDGQIIDYLYNDMALVVVGGTGTGNTFRVTGWVGSGDKSGLVLDRDISYSVGSGSIFALVPALKTSCRAAQGTIQTSHSNVQVNLYRSARVTTNYFTSFSTNEDMSYEYMIDAICGKAGVETVFDRRIDEMVNSSTGDITYVGNKYEVRNTIAKFRQTGCDNSSQWGVFFRGSIDYLYGYRAFITPTHVTLVELSSGVETVIESIPHNVSTINCESMISIFGNFVSFWIGHRFIGSMVIAINPSDALNKPYTQVFVKGVQFIHIIWGECDQRVDNWILDMGASGLELITNMIKERRIFLQDDQYGRLRVFRDRKRVDNTGYDLQITSSPMKVDSGLSTRMKLVGVDIKEAFDTSLLQRYGNLFELKYSQMLNENYEIIDEIKRSFGDYTASRFLTSYSGALDPRLEPQDIYRINDDGVDEKVVSSISTSISFSDTEALMDMNIEVHDIPSLLSLVLPVDINDDNITVYMDNGEIYGGDGFYPLTIYGVIQAMNQAYDGGGLVYVPSGTYCWEEDGNIKSINILNYEEWTTWDGVTQRFSDTLTIPPGVTLLGSSRERPIFKNMMLKMLYNSKVERVAFEIISTDTSSYLNKVCLDRFVTFDASGTSNSTPIFFKLAHCDVSMNISPPRPFNAFVKYDQDQNSTIYIESCSVIIESARAKNPSYIDQYYDLHLFSPVENGTTYIDTYYLNSSYLNIGTGCGLATLQVGNNVVINNSTVIIATCQNTYIPTIPDEPPIDIITGISDPYETVWFDDVADYVGTSPEPIVEPVLIGETSNLPLVICVTSNDVRITSNVFAASVSWRSAL